MTTLRSTVRKLWQTSPADLSLIGKRRLRRRLGNGDHGCDYSLEAVLRNPKHMNIKLEIERWERQWRICRLQGLGDVEEKFDFSGKTLLEVGCGPVFGCGPIALFKGAKRFWYQDPDFHRTVVESQAIKKQYFHPLYQELIANYGKLMSFDDWYSTMMELGHPLQLEATGTVDITISHSVL